MRMRRGFWSLAATIGLAAGRLDGFGPQDAARSGYSYVRDDRRATSRSSRGGTAESRRAATCRSPWATRSPIRDRRRVEIGLADGNVLHVGGGTHVTLRLSLRPAGRGGPGLRHRALRRRRVLLSAVGRTKTRSRASTPTTRRSTWPRLARARQRDPRRGTVVIVPRRNGRGPDARRLLHGPRGQLPDRSPGEKSPKSRAALTRAIASTSGSRTASRPSSTNRRARRPGTSAPSTPATSPRSTATETGTTTPPTAATSGRPHGSTPDGAPTPRAPGTTRRRA